MIADVTVRMTKLVAAFAREKLASLYNLRDFTDPLAAEVEIAAILEAVDKVPARHLMQVVVNLQCEGSLKPLLLLAALKERKLGFLTAALSVLTKYEVGHVA